MRILSVLMLNAATMHGTPSPEEMQKMGAFIEELTKNGTLIDTGGRDADMLELTVTRKNGQTSATDGPFAESKELVGGYALLEVKDRAEAIAVSERFLELVGDATLHVHEVSVSEHE
ncbi:MAG TPA: YciI family protein [Candidatus Baltobacteraceae bacterium]|jgi:hypothetical protein|nr:YciI family protein [Candidatus Baltobacteraceae bacterium]